jgi:ribosomal protein S10
MGNKYTSLPNKVTKKTVLRSPHIDKRSREQFEKITRHSMVYIPFLFSDLRNILKYSVPSFGVITIQKNTLNR